MMPPKPKGALFRRYAGNSAHMPKLAAKPPKPDVPRESWWLSLGREELQQQARTRFPGSDTGRMRFPKSSNGMAE